MIRAVVSLSLVAGAAAAAPAVQLPIFVPPQFVIQRWSNYTVLHCAYGPPASNLSAVAGSIYVNTDEIEYDIFSQSSEDPAAASAKHIRNASDVPRNWWRLYPDEYLLPAFAFMGITKDSKVAVYGAPDPIAGFRVAWALLKAGVADVRVVDGGIAAWQAAGGAVSNTTAPRVPAPGFGTNTSLRPELLANTAELRFWAEDVPGSVADFRMKCEYEGTCLPYHYIKARGRVEGAVWAAVGNTDLRHMEGYLFPNGTRRPLPVISELWARLKICPAGQPCAFYCGTGWRSSLGVLTALDLGIQARNHDGGFTGPTNYDGGFYLYATGPDESMDPVIVGK
eukprot:TRINITY_DN948_c1_g1_i1.p2 TRINITY_DN948_c1_g1~~TRINITY_DN948_c1_g1_i1.p2  ORF type:complete len:338 (+),score=79.65 TRINITY_DN948_c1_g1_i1:98-1111(+)